MKESRLEQKRSKNRAKTGVCEISQPLRNKHFAAKPFRNLKEAAAESTCLCESDHPLRNHFAAQAPLCKNFRSCETKFGTRVPLRSTGPPFRSCETVAKLQSVKIPIFAVKAPFRRVFRNCESDFGTRVPLRSTVTLNSQLRNGL